MSARFRILCALNVAVMAAVGCQQEPSVNEPAVAPARATAGVVHLATAGQKTIGIETAAVALRDVPEVISTTGWLAEKPGNRIVVKAGATGFVVPREGSSLYEPGAAVSLQEPLATLHVFISPQEEAQLVALKEDADTLIRQSQATLAIAEDRYEAARDLHGVLPTKEVQALQETVERSRAAVEEAREKLPFLPIEPYERPLRLKDVKVEAPLSGQIMEVHARPRQLVVQGDPLWTIADWSVLWLRVPVFEDDLPRVRQDAAAEVSAAGEEKPLTARPSTVPRPMQPGRRTVDLLYEIDNNGATLRPGQPVSVSLPTGGSGAKLLVPRAALLWDGMGNAWVYVRESAEAFRRQRVEVGRSVEDSVVIERGLVEGQQVVVVGAEALYGEEFKSQINVGEDDD